MAAINNQDYWELAQKGTLCDLILVEKTATDTTTEYPVHKVIVYLAAPYFKTFFDQNMKDSNTNRITIESESATVGLLGIVIEAMYATAGKAERIYYTFAGEHHIDKTMHLYMICLYLCLDSHMRYLRNGLRELVVIDKLTAWWRNRYESGKVVPPKVEEMIQDHLRKSIKFIGCHNEAYISVNALKSLWPTTNDPIANSMHDFLDNIYETAEDGNDDPNEWMSEEEEGPEILPASSDHPELLSHDSTINRWLHPVSQFIFTQNLEKEWYIDSRFNVNSQLAEPLTMDDRKEARGLGWLTDRSVVHRRLVISSASATSNAVEDCYR
uniref:BTB/POZ domain protein n=1 Tax=Marseillevirus LCMAC202 TaxID=2506606 RepID=A0A481YYL9_9VIRU|nr:MAG: BTB/POZ domain protein [Marseillevirus LCMAC202]